MPLSDGEDGDAWRRLAGTPVAAADDDDNSADSDSGSDGGASSESAAESDSGGGESGSDSEFVVSDGADCGGDDDSDDWLGDDGSSGTESGGASEEDEEEQSPPASSASRKRPRIVLSESSSSSDDEPETPTAPNTAGGDAGEHTVGEFVALAQRWRVAVEVVEAVTAAGRFECGVCSEERTRGQLAVMNCGHNVCEPCWRRMVYGECPFCRATIDHIGIDK